MPKSFYLDGNVINVALRGIAYTAPVASYIALYTTAPTAAGGGVEVTGGSYARRPVTWTAPSSGQSSNSAYVTFAVATDTWGTVTSYGLFDALVAGNMLYWGDLNAPRLIVTNDQFVLPTGQLIVVES